MIFNSKKTISTLINYFQKYNMISEEELKKYYLDETGKYIPKLKTNQNLKDY